MTKKLLIPLCLAASLHGMGQTDVSASFLKNSGFDEEFNYGADRRGNVSGDVINEIYGWTNETTGTYTVTGTFAYNPQVTFNGSYPLPASGYEGSAGGALALTTGWGVELAYSQPVNLPRGRYRLCSAYYNVGTATIGRSLLSWTPDRGVATVSAVDGFPVRDWTPDELTFTLSSSAKGRIRIGFGSVAGTGSANQAKILVDYVKLFYESDPKAELEALLSSAATAYGDGSGAGAADLKPVMDEAQALWEEEDTAVGDVLAVMVELEEALQAFRYANASPDRPFDRTSLIVNPSFESGTEGWDNQGFSEQTNSYFPGKSGSTYMERWVNRGDRVPDVSLTQTLEDIPNGKYCLYAGVGNIQQTASGSSVNAGAKQTGVELFADRYAVPVDTVKSRKRLDFTVVDGQVTLGLRAEDATGNWVCFDNLALYYLGANTAEDYAAYLLHYAGYVRRDLLAGAVIQNSVRKEAEAAVESAERAVSAAQLDQAAMEAAKADLDEAVAAIGASSSLYGELAESLAYAGQVAEWYEDDAAKHAKMEAAISAAQSALGNQDLTETEIRNAVSVLETVTKQVDKGVYTAQWSMGDVSDPENNYYIGRTRQSKNWILFWEKGYGENPASFTCGNYTVDVDGILRQAEEAFAFYTDSLKFIEPGRSQTDSYKMVIRLRYEPAEWEATGSGVDDRIGLLTLTPWAANSRGGQTVYHEIGHCFQYQVHCDNGNQNGWMYSPGNGKGCAFWEQCAQWQAYKIMPGDQFTNEWFSGYLQNVHKHILHESPRYNNYFIQDYWTYKHGMDFIGRLWNESRNPEDAVEAYMRITGITDSEFNDEMYDCAARFATWDIPALEEYGASQIDSRPQPGMVNAGEDYWRISPAVAPENTGHNIIKLNAPLGAKTVTACFEGLNRASGYRVKNPTYAEWRYGFVAQLYDGNRVYSKMGKATYSQPKDTLRFDCPARCRRLYFVVSGGPKAYWRQVWDDNDANDEQWPYQVKFGNTNRYGSPNLPDVVTGVEKVSLDADLPSIYVSGSVLHIGASPVAGEVRVATLSGVSVATARAGREETGIPLEPGFYLVQVLASDGRVLLTEKVLVP